jgi:hypothetical protein
MTTAVAKESGDREAAAALPLGGRFSGMYPGLRMRHDCQECRNNGQASESIRSFDPTG